MTTINGLSKKVLLVILDGFGVTTADHQNAIKHAHTPNLDHLFKNYPYTNITAGGELVGLPKGVCGNSEVGHMNLGSGRAVRQDLVRINEAIANNTFADLEKFKELILKARNNTKRIHLMGLLSDGGVHAHIDHIKKIVELLNQEKDLSVYFHAFMDGRDTPRDSGEKYIKELEEMPGVTLASIQGRSIGMDRDRRWEKIALAYNTFVGLGTIVERDAIEYLREQYATGKYDEFIDPLLFNKDYAIKQDDCVFFVNYRPDRAIQLALAFNLPNFKEFNIPIKPAYFLCMSPYIQEEVELPVLFDKEKIKGGLSEYLSGMGYKQYKIAETEKYAHVTYFYNGGEKGPFPGEKHVLVPSPKEVETYDLKPEMSAPEVTDKLVDALDSEQFDYYLVNYANSDMVGHTGNYAAAVKAIETLDRVVQRLMDKCSEKDITMLLTADHGNSDQMAYADGNPHTSHTNAQVPFVLFNKLVEHQKYSIALTAAALKDVAPTVLAIMGVARPTSFTGQPIFN